MGEFVKIMQDWQRMCDGTRLCGDCGLNGICKSDPNTWKAEEMSKAESVITDWAARHPAPTYPSWLKWLHQQIPDLHGIGDYDAIRVLATTQIPNELAEKLKIPPEE